MGISHLQGELGWGHVSPHAVGEAQGSSWVDGDLGWVGLLPDPRPASVSAGQKRLPAQGGLQAPPSPDQEGP